MLKLCENIAEQLACKPSSMRPGGAVAGFSKHRWPPDGPERELLVYLDELHREQGQPSMARIAKAVGLVSGTVSAFFTAARPIGPERLKAVVEYLRGNVEPAQKLRGAAATLSNDPPRRATGGRKPAWSPPPNKFRRRAWGCWPKAPRHPPALDGEPFF